jgi:GrpB-like predicted nucleotidyltransferase (UPF0157 family)
MSSAPASSYRGGMPSAEDIVTFSDTPPPPGATPWVGAAEPARDIAIVDPSPSWPRDFELLRDRIERALGERAIAVEHVGSTSVPSLPAKPIIDIDLIVADSTDEEAYVPALEAAGFTLRIREPWWYEHRCLAFDDPRCNLHVWSPSSPEAVRHVMFRDWLRRHPEDLALYRDAKVAAAAEANARGEHVMQYNERKQATIREIYGRAFAAAGLIG